jgi:adenylate cyclase class 2
VRTITSEGTVRTVLTYKEPAVDEVSRSKPEHETEVAGAQVLHAILTGLGLTELISFRKECVNYRFQRRGRDFLATVVTVPELGDTTFIEIETIVEPADLDDALLAARDVLAELGIVDDDLTSQTYTDAVAEARRSPERSAKTITAR